MSVNDREMLTRQIRDAVDIVDLIGGYLTLRRAGSNFKGLCPFHEEKTPSFNVSPVKQIFKCYGCGAGGDVFTFVQMREKVPFPDARRMLAERAGIALERESGTRSGGPGKADLIRVNGWAARVFQRNYAGPVGDSARQYVAGRGISPESAEAFGIGLAVDSFDSLIRLAQTSKVDVKLLAAAGLVKERTSGGHYDTFRHRLMFPIADAAGRTIGFGGRTLGDDPAKYLNTPATLLFDKSNSLFGLDRARQAMTEAGRAIVVEGYTDCIMAHQCGFKETVATLGTAMTDAHAANLRRYTDRVILVFDSDDAGQRAADRALSVTLTGGLDVHLARVPEGKDPCDYLLSAGHLAFDSVLKAAKPALEFKWQQVVRDCDASATGPGRRRAIEAYLFQLTSWVGRGVIDPIQMGLLVNQLGKILTLPPEDVHSRLQAMVKESARRAAGKSAGSVSTDPAAAERKMDVEQRALRQILEVLLNEPHRYPDVADRFQPAALHDPALAAVAKAFIETIDAGEAFHLGNLIRRFELPAFATLITDLQTSGERRSGYDAVVAGALQCLSSAGHARRTAQLAGVVRGERADADGVSAPSTEDEQLTALAISARHPHFASPRARKKFLE